MTRDFLLYKIYYQGKEDVPEYLGRTNQGLASRLRGHFFKKPMHRTLDVNLVSRIEYAECGTEADRNVYEVYYINLLKPPLNVDDKCRDKLTITLPELEWKLWDREDLLEKWRAELREREGDYEFTLRAEKKYGEYGLGLARRLKCDGIISEDEYYYYKELGEKLGNSPLSGRTKQNDELWGQWNELDDRTHKFMELTGGETDGQ